MFNHWHMNSFSKLCQNELCLIIEGQKELLMYQNCNGFIAPLMSKHIHEFMYVFMRDIYIYIHTTVLQSVFQSVVVTSIIDN